MIKDDNTISGIDSEVETCTFEEVVEQLRRDAKQPTYFTFHDTLHLPGGGALSVSFTGAASAESNNCNPADSALVCVALRSYLEFLTSKLAVSPVPPSKDSGKEDGKGI